MATIINNRSNLVTDPVRNFRFLVEFLPHGATGTTSVPAESLNSSSAYSATNTLPAAAVGFTSVSGLTVATDAIPYREGGYNTTIHQIPGQTQFTPVTFQRGVLLGTPQNWNWMKKLFVTVNGNTAKKSQTDDFRFDVEIKVLSHPIAGGAAGLTGTAGIGGYESDAADDDHVSMRFKLYNCWPTALAYSDLNAGDNALLVEQMTLVHEGFDVKWGTDLTETGAAPVFEY